ncbi:hypothetical protein ASD60_20735 [Pseudomonas sp. Root562]|nr:hypothetical protein ASD60_20735 [Pseudomonas sp. Root562]
MATRSPVEASLLAMDVNDDAGCLNERGAFASIASRLVPAGECGNKKGDRSTAPVAFSCGAV